MILYHGSNTSIDNIDLTRCNRYKDFGQAFYLTTDLKQAEEVAKARTEFFGGEPVINTYEFDETLLTDGSLAFQSFPSYTDEWTEFVFNHRDETNVPPHMHNFDIVYGPIANDRVGMQVRNYRQGYITLEEFRRRLQYMKGETYQYAFCTTRAISKLRKL